MRVHVEAKLRLLSEKLSFAAFVCGSQVPAKSSIDSAQRWSTSA